jgi:hypothetical protein
MNHKKLSKLQSNLSRLVKKHARLKEEIHDLRTHSPVAHIVNDLHITALKFRKRNIRREMTLLEAAIQQAQCPAPGAIEQPHALQLAA